jgi:hypothetical protein
MLKQVTAFHSYCRAGPREAIDHRPDQRWSRGPIKVLLSIESSSWRASPANGTMSLIGLIVPAFPDPSVSCLSCVYRWTAIGLGPQMMTWIMSIADVRKAGCAIVRRGGLMRCLVHGPDASSSVAFNRSLVPGGHLLIDLLDPLTSLCRPALTRIVSPLAGVRRKRARAGILNCSPVAGLLPTRAISLRFQKISPSRNQLFIERPMPLEAERLFSAQTCGPMKRRHGVTTDKAFAR